MPLINEIRAQFCSLYDTNAMPVGEDNKRALSNFLPYGCVDTGYWATNEGENPNTHCSEHTRPVWKIQC